MLPVINGSEAIVSILCLQSPGLESALAGLCKPLYSYLGGLRINNGYINVTKKRKVRVALNVISY